MKEKDHNGKASFLEIISTSSTFISTVLIALVSIFVTTQYNNKQLEIAQIKEISTLIPKLGSDNENERKFSAIALGLYGKNAVPPLIAILDDSKQDVRDAGSKSIALIGEEAVPALEEAFRNKKNSENLRATSLWTLGSMNAPSGLTLAREALSDSSENPTVRKDAATALGFLKDKDSIGTLLKVLERAKVNDDTLTESIVWSLGRIADPSAIDSLMPLLEHANEKIRLRAIWALSQFKSDEVTKRLQVLMEKDSSDVVKDAAKRAIEWQKRIQ